MKVVCVADAYITAQMMEEGVRPALGPADSLEIFFFGLPGREQMRDMVRTLEKGGRDSLPLPEGLAESVKDADCLIVHLCPVTKTLLAGAGKLKAVMSCRGGREHLDLEAAAAPGFAVSTNPAHNARAVAEYTIGLILAETRNICRSHCALKAGEWRKEYPNTGNIRELGDMTVGVVGYGSVGRMVAERLLPFGCRVLVHDPFAPADGMLGLSFVTLPKLLAESDIISLHARSSKPIITDAEFALMKRGAVLINTARAVLIDSSALKRALDGGILLGAALDVFDTEPDIPAYLREYDNVTLSSHRAGDTINSYKDAPAFAIGNFLGWLEGKPLKFKV